MTTHPQLARLHIPHQGSPVPSALFTPALPSALQQSFHLATPLNTNFGAQIPPHPQPRHGMHRAHPSLMFPGPAAALAAAGIAPPSGMPITPSGMSSHAIFGPQAFQRGSRRTSSISMGGPPKAPLGGPQGKHSPMPVTAPTNTANYSVSKLKKVVVRLPIERLQILSDGTEATDAVYSLWSRKPLPHIQAPKMDHVVFPEATNMDMHPIEQSNALPATIDVFLPGKGAWDEYKQSLIEMKLQRLGVEPGGNSAPSGQSHLHGRAASISSPADPALLLFKLNKLQQSQNGSLSVSPQPSSSIPASSNPLPPRFQQNTVAKHGHSVSLANLNTHVQVFNPIGAFNPFGPTATLGSDQVIGQSVPDISSFHNAIEHDPPPQLHAPQGVVPLSLNMQSDTTTVSSSSSRVASTVPDFNRGFGLDIPEEDEDELEAFGNVDGLEKMLSLDEGKEDDINETEDDATTTGAHTRHVSRASVALSLKSMGGRSGRLEVEDTIEENAPPELENPVQWNITSDVTTQATGGGRDAQVDPDPVEEWTGSEDNGSFEEFSNPSDEERAMQARKTQRERRARQPTHQDHETPRRLPEFPRPPEGGLKLVPHASNASDDIISNPSEEGEEAVVLSDWLHPGQHQQDLAYFQPVVDEQPRSPRPLPPLPHSRTASANYSHPSTMQHSRHTSSRINDSINDSELPNPSNGSLPKRDTLNPFAKPFVFGATTSSGTQVDTSPSSGTIQVEHVRHPSSGHTLNAAAAEFKPGFTFLPPPGVPRLSFPAAETSRPLPQPPSGTSPSRMQGREKRQRRGSSAVGDEDTDDEGGRNTMGSFKFPSSSSPSHSTGLHALSPTIPLVQRAISPMPQRKPGLNAAALPFKFPSTNSLPFVSKEPSTLPYPLISSSPVGSQTVAGDVQHSSTPAIPFTPEETHDVTSDIAIGSEQSPVRKRPPVLDFKHPVSTNTVPAALFRRTLMSGDLEGPTRATVRSRLSSREIYEHMNSPSLDDTNVPTISGKFNVSQPRMTEQLRNQPDPPPDQPAEKPVVNNEAIGQRHKLPISTNNIASPISESMLSSYNRRREDADQIEQRLEDMLDDRMELAKKDLTEAHGQAADQIVGQVIAAIRTQLSELAFGRSDDAADARGEVDFELIRNTLEQGVMDIRTGLRRDLEEVLRSVESAHLARESSAPGLPVDFHRIMEEFGNRTISAVTNAVVKFAARIDQIDEFARVRAADERELLLSEIFNILAPRLDSLRQQPIDFDVVTAKLAEAVKPHISQLIDLTSDKKETAGLIVQRLMPALSALSQTPAHVDTDAIVSQLRVEVARMAPSSDPHVIKEAVADLVVERLDSRLAVREKSASNETLYSRISECIDDLHIPVSDVRKAVEGLRMGQEAIQEQGAMLNTLHQDMASHLLGLPGAVNTAVEAIHAAGERLTSLKDTPTFPGDLTQILPQLESIDSTVKNLATSHELLMSQSSDLVSLHDTLQTSVTSLPNSLAEAVASLKQSQMEFLSRSQLADQSGEVRSLSASNAELQVQLAKARGAHGQIRVEKDLMVDRMTAAEADRDTLRSQLEELRSRSSAKETEVAAAGLRITELEDALSHALARLQSSEITDKAKAERISTLEQQNRELGLEQFQFKSQIQKLELQQEWLTKDKDSLAQRLAQAQKDCDNLAHQQSHWEELRRTSEQVGQLTRLIGAADSAEMAELKRANDRSKILEGEHASLQKRFKEQEGKLANIERASQTARQGMAQAQQRASEWEKRTKELEADLDATRSRLDDAEEAKLQLDSDLSLVKMHLEEKETVERVAKETETKLRAEVSSLESQLSGLKSELENLKLEKVKQVRQPPIVNSSSAVSPSPPTWGTNGYAHGREPRPSSRGSTVYGGRSPVTPTDVSFRSGRFPSRAPSVAPESPKGVWGSMHAPRAAQHSSSTLPYPARPAIPSPTPSTVSLAPTQGDDGWWS